MNKYQTMLKEMNFKVAEKTLIYVHEKIKVNNCK